MIQNTDSHFEGIIIASKWDKGGEVIQISLLTRTEDEFIILMDKNGKSLIPLCQSAVKIKGALDMNGLLTVISFTKTSLV